MSAAQGDPTVLSLSPRLRIARVAALQAAARFDALTKEPAAVAWAAVMDALYALVSAGQVGVPK